MNKFPKKSQYKLWIKIKQYVKHKSFGILFLTGCLMCLGLEIFTPWQIVQAMPPSVSGKIDRQSSAIAQYSSGQYREAIKLWTDALTQTSDNKTRATLHTNLGSAYRQIGSMGEAIASWEKAAKIYRSQNDKQSNRLLAQVLTEQGQAYNALGQSRIALPILKTAIELTQKNQDASTEAAARGALGNAYLALGDFEEAIASQKASLELATKLNDPKLITIAANNLGNVFKSRYQRYMKQSNSAKREGDEKEETRLLNLAKENKLAATKYYENCLQSSQAVGEMLQVKALLNLARLLDMGESSQHEISKKYRQQAMLILDKEPDSRAKIYALINLAQNLEDTAKIENLSKAIAYARNIGDQRAESFALTALGEIYFSSGDFVKAMQLAQSSAFAAQQVNAADSLYRAQVLAGRINKKSGFLKEAISSYRQAIATLQTIRGDLAVASKDLQFDLRDSTEPVYRELMALLLEDKGKWGT
ncbi:tetratricopeptide repeat protein, partial [Plectonema radiosum NIES-515]